MTGMSTGASRTVPSRPAWGRAPMTGPPRVRPSWSAFDRRRRVTDPGVHRCATRPSDPVTGLSTEGLVVDGSEDDRLVVDGLVNGLASGPVSDARRTGRSGRTRVRNPDCGAVSELAIVAAPRPVALRCSTGEAFAATPVRRDPGRRSTRRRRTERRRRHHRGGHPGGRHHRGGHPGGTKPHPVGRPAPMSRLGRCRQRQRGQVRRSRRIRLHHGQHGERLLLWPRDVRLVERLPHSDAAARIDTPVRIDAPVRIDTAVRIKPALAMSIIDGTLHHRVTRTLRGASTDGRPRDRHLEPVKPDPPGRPSTGRGPGPVAAPPGPGIRCSGCSGWTPEDRALPAEDAPVGEEACSDE